MQTVLFNKTIFGPIHSRRLGTSLGVNLSPNDGKVCSFDCLYCEAGYNAQGPGTTGLPTKEKVLTDLEAKLRAMCDGGENLDVITFSGNGEPTVHPEFGAIVDGVIALRDKYFPEVKISVLTNSTRLENAEVRRALSLVDNNILKLDSAIPETVKLLDRPNGVYDLEKVIDRLAEFGEQGIIQTMFTRGSHDGKAIDNTTDAEVEALIDAYRRIRPGQIMIYSIDRKTPEESLQKVSREELAAIAYRITAATNIPVSIA